MVKICDDDCFLLNMERVITISEVRDRESIGMYHKFIRQRKKNPTEGSQDPTVGYVSKVSEARIMFEKLIKEADL